MMKVKLGRRDQNIIFQSVHRIKNAKSQSLLSEQREKLVANIERMIARHIESAVQPEVKKRLTEIFNEE